MFFNSKILAAIMAFSATLSVCGGKIDIAVWNNCGRNRPGATVSFTVNIPANEALEKPFFQVRTADGRVIPAQAQRIAPPENDDKTAAYSIDFPAYLTSGKNLFILEYSKDIVPKEIDGAPCMIFYAPDRLWACIKNSTGSDIAGTADVFVKVDKEKLCKAVFTSKYNKTNSSIHRIVCMEGVVHVPENPQKELLRFEADVHTFAATGAVEVDLKFTNISKMPLVLKQAGWECAFPEIKNPVQQIKDDVQEIKFNGAAATLCSCLKTVCIERKNNILRFTGENIPPLPPERTIALRTRIAFGAETAFTVPPAVEVLSGK